MKKNLEILIDELQTECDCLQKQLDLCIKDADFEGAYFLNKSLLYTKRRLRILQNIQNPNRDKIALIRRNIEHLKGLKVNDYTIQRIADCQAELDKLQTFQSEKYALESEKIASSLEALSAGKIRKINLQLGSGHGIEIHFKLKKKTLYLQLTKIHLRRKNAILKNIGFEIQQDNMSMQIPDFDQSKISYVLEILAQVIYDGLALRGNEKAKIIIS